MSLWEFAACMDGVAVFNGAKPRGSGGDMDEARLAELGIEGFDE